MTMTDQTKLLSRVRLRSERGERISADDCAALFEVKNLIEFARLARLPRERRFGRESLYRAPIMLDYNGEHPEFFLSEIETTVPEGTREVALHLHHVDGESTAHWVDRIRELSRGSFGATFLISAGFVSRLVRSEGSSNEVVIGALASAGTMSLSAEDAEVFDHGFRSRQAPDVISSGDWLAIHRAAHSIGLKTAAGMCYGTRDWPAEYGAHLDAIRTLQDETGGFIAFAPMALHNPSANDFFLSAPTAVQTLRATAIARVFLDNIPHILASPALVSLEIATVALSHGADTVDTTIRTGDVHALESEVGSAGDPFQIIESSARSSPLSSQAELVRSRLIEARWKPVRVDMNFEPIELLHRSSI